MARLTDIAAGYAQVRRMDRAAALAELDQALADDGIRDRADRIDYLSAAAALYVDAEEDESSGWWADAAVGLLVEASADVDAARQHPTALHRARLGERWRRTRQQ